MEQHFLSSQVCASTDKVTLTVLSMTLNCSHKHHTRTMIETLLATALMVGSVEIGPGIYHEQYLTTVDNVPVLIEIETDVD